MHNQHRAQSGQFWHRLAQVGFCDVGEFIYAGVDQKTFEADHARIPELRQFSRITGHHSTPKRSVDHQLAARGRQLCMQSIESGCGGYRVERHVHDRGHTPGRSRARRSRKTFPLSPARLVDMHVAVDEARHHDRVFAGFDNLATRRSLCKSSEGADSPRADMNGRRGHSTR